MMTLAWKRGVILVLGSAFGVGLLAACGSPQAPRAAAAARVPQAITVRVAPATTGSISVNTAYAAVVEAKDQVNVVPLATGRIEKLSVDIGSELQRGQVMAELSHGTLDAQLQQAQAALRNAQAKLAVVQAVVKPNQLKAQAQLDTARAKLRQLLAPSPLDLQAAASAVAEAQTKLESAKTKLDQLLDPSTSDLQAAESAVATAEANLNSAKTKLDKLLVPSASDLQVAESAVETAQANLNSAKTKLDRTLNPPAADVAAAQAAVAEAQTKFTAAQTIVDQAISTHLSGGSMTSEIRFAWQTLLKVRLQSEANTAKLQSLPQAFGLILTPIEIAQAQQSVATSRAIVSVLLEQINPDSLIPEKIRDAMWAESSAQVVLDSAKAKLNALQSPDQYATALAQNDVAKEQAALNSAKAKLNALQNPDQNATALAQDDVAKEQAALNSARAKLRALRDPDRSTIALAQYNVDAARASLDATVAKSNLLKNPNPKDVAAAEAEVAIAEQTVAINQEPFTRQDIEASRALVDQAQAQVDLVKQQLAETQVLAPFDGFVTKRWLAPGAMASPQTPIATIAGREVAVSVRVEETGISTLQKGQRVTFTSPALPGQRLDLQVDQIAPAGDEKAHTFSVQLRPVGAPPNLRPGMSGQVSIVTERERAVLVPKEAVLYQGGQSTLFVVQDGKANLRRVDGGLVDTKNVEIKNGVQPGEQVVVSAQNLLNEGDLVSIDLPAERRRPPG